MPNNLTYKVGDHVIDRAGDAAVVIELVTTVTGTNCLYIRYENPTLSQKCLTHKQFLKHADSTIPNTPQTSVLAFNVGDKVIDKDGDKATVVKADGTGTVNIMYERQDLSPNCIVSTGSLTLVREAPTKASPIIIGDIVEDPNGRTGVVVSKHTPLDVEVTYPWGTSPLKNQMWPISVLSKEPVTVTPDAPTVNIKISDHGVKNSQSPQQPDYYSDDELIWKTIRGEHG